MKLKFSAVYVALLVFIWMAVGCATTANVSPNTTFSKTNCTFLIQANKESDPINVASVIQNELSKMGYRAEFVTLKSKPPESSPRPASGSGFFVSSDGILITNSHVVKDAESITISTMDGSQARGKIIAIDPQNDLAILKSEKPFNLTKCLPIGRFRQSKIGDDIRIIGYPLVDILGNRPRVTEGIISSDVGMLNNPTRFQVSASIQPGNSGGPIITRDLSVIGVATEKLSDSFTIKATGSVPQNVNFGVKIEYLLPLLSEEIEKSIETNKCEIESIEDAIYATALVRVNTEEIKRQRKVPSNSSYDILVTFSYRYIWDVFQYTLPRLDIYFTDQRTGEVVATANHIGSSLFSYVGVTRQSLQEIFKKLR